MIIQLPEWKNWRISGSETDWQVQYRQKRGKDGESWNGRYFFNCLEYAAEKAYELTLRESSAECGDAKAVRAECKRVKDALVREIKDAR